MTKGFSTEDYILSLCVGESESRLSNVIGFESHAEFLHLCVRYMNLLTCGSLTVFPNNIQGDSFKPWPRGTNNDGGDFDDADLDDDDDDDDGDDDGDGDDDDDDDGDGDGDVDGGDDAVVVVDDDDDDR